MGIIVVFPTESARRRASIEPAEPADVIILPVVYIPPLENEQPVALLPAPRKS